MKKPPPGPSLRLALLGAVWLACTCSAQAVVLFNTNATWKYFKGRTEASTPDTTAWRSVNFLDTGFTTGSMPFWYGDVFPGGTQLTDMMNQYTTLFLRRTFVVTNLADVSGLKLGFLCDDGFIAWINGVEFYRYNAPAGAPAYNAIASGATTEPVPFVTTDLANVSMIVLGTNVMAVQVFNAALTSTDLGINISLATIAPDLVPPIVAGAVPAPGTLNSLSEITVTFSEPMVGVNASDLLLNGAPASAMTGGNDTYTFTFSQPAYGTVSVAWTATHGITDTGIPANTFNRTGPGATWQYQLVDNIAPTLLYQLPFASATVRALNQIEASFSEPVTGVDPADLLINSSAATNVSQLAPGRFLFRFPPPLAGTVQVRFAAGHSIRDQAAVPNSFSGGNWTYVLDPNAPVTSVRLNELVAANVNGLRDEDNEPQDWIELYNTSSNTVSLAGWTLSDDADEPDKWVFPPVAIGPRAYLVVFCSGKDRRPTTPGSRLHTNFQLSPDGEFLGLYNSEAPQQLVSSFDPYPNQRRGYSFGYDGTEQLRYFPTPTPGSVNPISAISGVVSDTKFSHDRGFYTNAFFLSITCATPGVTLRYTLNGTTPTTNNGFTYTTPLRVTNTSVIRAFAYKSNLLPSDSDTHTYLFLDDVIRQAPTGAAPPGWPSSWGANSVDYGMDPAIVNAAPWNNTIKNDLRAIPTFSIVMSLDDLFNSATGIYANPRGDTIAWERPASLELVHPDDREGFQINCGIRIRGGFSRDPSNPKHAFRLFFRQEYGNAKLDYPVFGQSGAPSYDKFDLRTMQNYSWSFGGDGNMMCLRDQSSRDAQLKMNGVAARGDWYHLYINGMYWGLYNSEERPEASFGESYLGGREEDYDVIKVSPDDGYIIYATDGTLSAWTRLWQAATNGFANDVEYFKVQGLNVDGTPNPAYENLLDVANLIDYMLVIVYGGNLDAPISAFLSNTAPNNWYGMRNRTGLFGGFRFISHDAEHTLLNASENRIGPFDAGDPVRQGAALALTKSNPQYIWTRLWANAEFKIRMADRVQKHLFNGGPLSVQGVRASLMTRSNEIQRAIVGESARWGDAKVATPYTRTTWQSAFQGVYNGFAAQRTATMLSQLRSAGLFPTVNAPLFNHYGGAVSNGLSLFLTNGNAGGTLYYTLNGADPRVRGGNPSASALSYVAGTPLAINYPTTVRARVRNGTVWSALTEATFYPGQDFSGLIFTEIMYNPPGSGATTGDEFEFLELKNVGSSILDLSGVFTEGIAFAFTNGTRLAPGQFFVLGRNATTLAARYPGLVPNGLYTGRLDNGGETITFRHPLGTAVTSVDYKDGGKWPITADGHGFSIVSRTANANLNPDNPASWRASANPGGSPGADDPLPVLPSVRINEVLTHSASPLVDYIELYNPTLDLVSVGGWFLTDDPGTPMKYRIPDDKIIPASGYLVFTEAEFNATPGTNNSFSLSSTGEDIYLFSADGFTNLTGYSHGFTFGAAATGVPFGRHVISTGEERFPAQTAGTPLAINSGPIVGPVVISRIMYHPPDLPTGIDDTASEYIVLQNTTTASVPLYHPDYPTNRWRVRGGVDYDFPPDLSLGPAQAIVLVSFNPDTDTAATAAFRARYSSGLAGLQLFGPYAGKLDNSSDKVSLQKPDPPDPSSVPYVVPYIVVDEVDYKDSPPWPTSADGGGTALERFNLNLFGDDPASWGGVAPLTITGIAPASIAARAGTNVTFTALAYGTGTLSYQWYREGNPVPAATQVSLTVTDVQLDEEGGYTVHVSDSTGSLLSGPAYLTVLVPPVFTQLLTPQTVAPGATVTLSAAITGNPAPFTSEWRRTSTPIQTITNVSPNRSLFQQFTAPTTPTTQTWSLLVRNQASPGGVTANSVNVFVMTDTDADGMPNDWENAHNLAATSPLDAIIDSDGDGMKNRDEFVAGTDPRDPGSCLKMATPSAGGPAQLTFQATAGRTYSVHYRDDNFGSAGWRKLIDLVAKSTTRTETVVDPSPGTNRVYRIATPQVP